MHCPLEDWFRWFNKGSKLWDSNVMAPLTLQGTTILGLGHIATFTTHSSCFFVSRRKNINLATEKFPLNSPFCNYTLHMLTYPVVNQHRNVMPHEMSISATPFQHCPATRPVPGGPWIKPRFCVETFRSACSCEAFNTWDFRLLPRPWRLL